MTLHHISSHPKPNTKYYSHPHSLNYHRHTDLKILAHLHRFTRILYSLDLGFVRRRVYSRFGSVDIIILFSIFGSFTCRACRCCCDRGRNSVDRVNRSHKFIFDFVLILGNRVYMCICC